MSESTAPSVTRACARPIRSSCCRPTATCDNSCATERSAATSSTGRWPSFEIPSLYERRRDIGELAQSFVLEAAAELEATSFIGLTRRARADIETAVVRAREVSVRRLRELMRDLVFCAAADSLPEALESDLVLPLLEQSFSFSEADRDDQDQVELESEFDLLIGRAEVNRITAEHNVSPRALNRLCQAIQQVIGEMGDRPRSYRNVVERTNKLSKVALWLVSGARTQADFRRYFGSLEAEMPTKSVAHQIFHEVFGQGDGE